MRTALLISTTGLLWLVGCGGSSKSTSEDSDGDGVVDAADCAPDDETRYPGATDIPDDGLDQDCNGSDTVTCFLDTDLDGHGSASTGLSQNGLCTDPGFSELDDDCDDADPTALPGGTEVADDGIDQDCSGTDTISCYEDLDGDGVGSSTLVLADDADCSATGRSAIDGDCDDTDLTAYPGADEVCDDGVDNDCDTSGDCDDDDCSADTACRILVAADGKTGEPGNLYRIDPATGTATTVGSVGFAITGLAFAPDGRLFGSEATQSGNRGTARLIEIDLDTGEGSVVGELFDGAINHNSTADLTFVGSRLLGWTESGDDPIEIDVTDGSVTVIGNSGISSAGSGLATDATGQVWFAPGRVNGSLYTLDPTTGVGTEVVGLSGGTYDNINSMSFLNGTLYAVETQDTGSTASAQHLVTIDTTTGVLTPVGTVPTPIDSLAAWPP